MGGVGLEEERGRREGEDWSYDNHNQALRNNYNYVQQFIIYLVSVMSCETIEPKKINDSYNYTCCTTKLLLHLLSLTIHTVFTVHTQWSLWCIKVNFFTTGIWSNVKG